jgi:hypothetical protein
MKNFKLSNSSERNAREHKPAQFVCESRVGRWQITTCFRPSSVCCSSPPWFYETFVWKFREDFKDRELVGDATRIGHIAAVQRILDIGEWRDVEEEGEE